MLPYEGQLFRLHFFGGGMSMVTCMSTTKTAVHVYEIHVLDQKKFRAPAWMRPRAPVGHLFVCLG